MSQPIDPADLVLTRVRVVVYVDGVVVRDVTNAEVPAWAAMTVADEVATVLEGFEHAVATPT